MNWPSQQAAFVTGAASGIGLGIARALVAAGAKVALADIDEERLNAASAELGAADGRVLAVPLDVTDPGAWMAAADRAERELGPISILVNNAGVIGTSGPMEQTPLKVWQWVFSINTEAQFIGISTFLPRFKERGTRAHIVNTSSLAGVLPMMNVGAYAASKYASVGLSLVLRDELKGTDIGVSLLVPGTVATPLTRTAGEAEAELLGREADDATIEANNSFAARGADPARVGEQVVEAMQHRQFMIVTHGEWGPVIARVHDEIENAFAEFDGRHGKDPAAELVDLESSSISPMRSA